MKTKPDGWPNVAPRLFSDDVAGLVGFIRAVFGASGDVKKNARSELRIGDSVLLVSDGGGFRDATSAFFYVYVADADDAYRRAGAAGAFTIEEPTDAPYGDRRATVRDPWGNVWQIATYGGG